MSGFVIDLATLSPGTSRVTVESEAADLDLPEGVWAGPIRGDLSVEMTGGKVTVRGTLSAVARLECVSCLKVFDQPIHLPFEAFADRTGSSRRKDDEAALERDDYMLFHDGRRLDLGDEARQNLLIELPMAPRCREECAGLCPNCGADLNLGPCGCGATGQTTFRAD